MLVIPQRVATGLNAYSPATSGMNPGFATDDDESVAVLPAGLRITLQSYEVAVDGIAERTLAAPREHWAESMAATSGIAVGDVDRSLAVHDDPGRVDE